MRKAKNSTEVLKAAQWMLENVGWIKGHSVKRDDQNKIIGFCSIGALYHVETNRTVRQLAEARLGDAMGGSIISFNDADETTKRKVINAFKRAIKNGSK